MTRMSGCRSSSRKRVVVRCGLIMAPLRVAGRHFLRIVFSREAAWTGLPRTARAAAALTVVETDHPAKVLGKCDHGEAGADSERQDGRRRRQARRRGGGTAVPTALRQPE